ncbi:MliC family protein [Aeromonas molluscorum]|uniref:MliC family protein n=1 Tax=Aeromonas molluscorum TaxID=271417 RepID=UPI003F1C3F84
MNKLVVLIPVLGLAACSSPQPTQYQYNQYQCGEEMLAVTYDPQADMVQFPLNGVYQKLGRVESEKESARYSDGVTMFWIQGDKLTLTQKGVTLMNCTLK